jgi:hypothetical protein
MEDHEHMVVAGVNREPASPSPPYSFTPARTFVKWHPDSWAMVGKQSRRSFVGDFATVVATLMDAINMEYILQGNI